MALWASARALSAPRGRLLYPSTRRKHAVTTGAGRFCKRLGEGRWKNMTVACLQPFSRAIRFLEIATSGFRPETNAVDLSIRAQPIAAVQHSGQVLLSQSWKHEAVMCAFVCNETSAQESRRNFGYCLSETVPWFEACWFNTLLVHRSEHTSEHTSPAEVQVLRHEKYTHCNT